MTYRGSPLSLPYLSLTRLFLSDAASCSWRSTKQRYLPSVLWPTLLTSPRCNPHVVIGLFLRQLEERITSAGTLLSALGPVLVLGPVERFPDAKHVTSYVGLIPQEHSSGGRQRFGRPARQLTGCALCWWKRPRQRAASTPDCAACIVVWRFARARRRPRWRWRASWPSGPISCCGTRSITRSFAGAPRTPGGSGMWRWSNLPAAGRP